jgi:hypothetical protein
MIAHTLLTAQTRLLSRSENIPEAPFAIGARLVQTGLVWWDG